MVTPWREHGPAAPHEVGEVGVACAADGVPTNSPRQITYMDAQ